MNIIEYHSKHMKLGGEIRADKKNPKNYQDTQEKEI